TIRTTNAYGCQRDTLITITGPPQYPLSVATTMPLCFGGSNGSLSITPLGGLAPYLYALGSGPYGSNASFTNLSAGTYVVHVRDANACQRDTTITIQQPAALKVTALYQK